MALTDIVVRRLAKPKKGRRERWDSEIPGLAVRVSDTGIRSYNFIYSFGTRVTAGGKVAPHRFRITLGRVGELTLEEAREKARDLRKRVRAGGHPAVEDKIARATAVKPVMFDELVAAYDRRVLVTKRRGKEVRAIINKHLAAWKGRPLSSISRADVLAAVEALIDAKKPEAARRVLSICQRLFNWTIARGTFGIEHSPCEKLRPADVIGKRSIRQRVLTNVEWRALFAALPKLGSPAQPMVTLLALTGLRLREVAEGRWSELDFTAKTWTLPPERTKAGVTHIVPLTRGMLRVLSSLPRKDGAELLFPGPRASRPFTAFSGLKKSIDKQMVEELKDPTAKLTDWRLHDLRRSMRTGLSELPVPGGDLVRELIIGHARPGLHQVYDQAAYLSEKHRGLELWEEKLAAILENRQADVIDLTQRASVV